MPLATDVEMTELAAHWTMPTTFEPFMEWLDGTGLGDTDEERVAAFMLLEIAKFMPRSLRDEFVKEGLLA